MKIALLGTSPDSASLVPSGWEIWACSPGTIGFGDRKKGGIIDVFFETHRFEPNKEWFPPAYCEFLKEFKGKLWLSKEIAAIPNGKQIPYKKLVKKYGPYFFTSSLAWMLAMAIEKKPEKISLWGVDMAAATEYFDQKLGCQYFALIAKDKGIEIGVPPESDLFRPLPLYGLCEHQHAWVKHRARQIDLMRRKSEADLQISQLTQEVFFLNGALDDLDYNMKTWVGGCELGDFTEMK